MSLRGFIASPNKTVTDLGAWNDKRMPKTGGKFPISKNKNFRVGTSGWRWRVATISSDGKSYRLLMMYHAGKENYHAYLGQVAGEDTLILGKLEYHSTHRGWHMHGNCKEPDMANAGRMKYPDMKRYPDGGRHHRRTTFGIDSDVAAHEIAARYFHLPDLQEPGGAQIAIAFAQP